MTGLMPRTEGAELRVMSSNILFDKSLPERLPLIADYYRSSDADVIGMQEVNNVGTELYGMLSDIYTPATTAHPDGKHCFSPIIYRHDRFDVVEAGSELHRKRATDTKSLAWVVLQHKETGKQFAVINTHSAIILPFHKLVERNEYEGEQWRTDNVYQMLAKRDELRVRYGAKLPIFMTGDFNALPTGASIATVKMFLRDSAEIATLSAVRTVNSYHGVPGRPCGEGGAIDFVFVSDDAIEVLTHNVPHDERAIAISDHCPVYADVRLK